MKEEILKLRSEGKSYREIELALGCSKGTIYYHCAPDAKTKNVRTRLKNCKDRLAKLKVDRGGQCERCGYNRCLAALDFHHTDPSTKDRTYDCIGAMIRTCSFAKAEAETKKCELICSNCHREHHYLVASHRIAR